MNAGLFVTGTDTGVGKTVVSACLLSALVQRGAAAMYMKPVQTGCDDQDGRRIAPDVDYVLQSAGIAPPAQAQPLMAPYRLLMSASPHLAAEQEGVTIDPNVIRDAFDLLQNQYDALIVEGAGGVMVPLTRKWLMLDLMVALRLPVVVVCRSGLGTLNHTLLTVRALRDVNLHVAGLVMVDSTPGERGIIEADNATTLASLSSVPIWGHIPFDPAIADGRVNKAFIAQCAANLLLPPSFPCKA